MLQQKRGPLVVEYTSCWLDKQHIPLRIISSLTFTKSKELEGKQIIFHAAGLEARQVRTSCIAITVGREQKLHWMMLFSPMVNITIDENYWKSWKLRSSCNASGIRRIIKNKTYYHYEPAILTVTLYKKHYSNKEKIVFFSLLIDISLIQYRIN